MKDSVKNALKRVTSGFLAVFLAVCLVGTPRSKAVVSEGALLGSIFGSLLVSLGYSWAADNFDAPTFGEAIYDLIKQCDEEMDTGIQTLLDANLAGLTAVGNGKLTFSHQWVRLANSFAEWFYNKFGFSDKTSANIYHDTSLTVLDSNGNPFNLAFESSTGSVSLGTMVPYGDVIHFKNGFYALCGDVPGTSVSCGLYNSNGTRIMGVNTGGTGLDYGIYLKEYRNSYSVGVVVRYSSNGQVHVMTGGNTSATDFLTDNGFISAVQELTAEKPQEVHYPEVADDGSQVYEVTYQGVTATDIEGIIQGAVDRILAGTASIVGSVEQAGTGEEVANPEIDPYKVSLSSVFPFCIPFDVYNMVTMLVAEPEAPNAEWTFTLPWSNKEYSVGWDLSDFDGVAQVCRNMEFVLFAVGLAVMTHKVIKW